MLQTGGLRLLRVQRRHGQIQCACLFFAILEQDFLIPTYDVVLRTNYTKSVLERQIRLKVLFYLMSQLQDFRPAGERIGLEARILAPHDLNSPFSFPKATSAREQVSEPAAPSPSKKARSHLIA